MEPMQTTQALYTRAAILKSPIPAGGCGRPLTTMECHALRQLGWHCAQTWIVIRQVRHLDYLGIVYRPHRDGGYDHINCYVETDRKGHRP